MKAMIFGVRTCVAAAVLAAVGWTLGRPAAANPPDTFVNVRETIPDIVLDIRYATPHNFIGRPIPGYEAPECLLTRQAAEALGRVQSALRPFGLALKVYDCYRPQRAVDAFVAWARDLDDQAMKAEFYPSVDKQNLFRDGYIAAKSGHSRGSTVDLTIVPLGMQTPALDAPADSRSCENAADQRFPDASIDMGTGYDCFSALSRTANPAIGSAQRANRLLLKQLMESSGFVNLAEEWWHFTLVDEPFPDTYFDFGID
ncbi:MAG: M15 family metallopeptidase [Gammaproteobacteria bacterium]